MSVLASKRSESKVQFIQNAVNLENETINLISRLSPKFARLFQNKVMDLAVDIVTDCESANSYFPKNAEDIAKRESLLKDAIAKTNALDVQLTLVAEILYKNPQGAFVDSNGNGLSASDSTKKLDNICARVGCLIDDQIRLAKGVIKSDADRKTN